MTIRKAVIPVAGLGTRHFPASHAVGRQHTYRPCRTVYVIGLKARHVIARPEGPGRITKTSQGLKGRYNVIHIPALQAGRKFVGTRSRGFTPGCHISGFQP